MFGYSSFWAPYPALFVGLILLLGSGFALFPSLLLPILLICLCATRGSYTAFLIGCVLALLAYSYASFCLPLRTLPEEKVRGSGQFHIEQVKMNPSFFQRSLLYKGSLVTFTTEQGVVYENLPCSIYLPDKKERPSATQDYEIRGVLCQKGDYHFVLKPDKKIPWIPYGDSSSLAELRFSLKKNLFTHIKQYISDPSSRNFLYALISGDVDEKLLTLSLGKVGLQHLLAVSGFHFSLLGGLILFLFRFLFPYRLSLIVLILALSGYFLFVGRSCAIERAYISFLLLYGGKLLHLRINPLNALGVSLIVSVLTNPLHILDLGFQFSFLCTLALILGTPILENVLNILFRKRTYAECKELRLLDQHAYLLCRFLRSSLSSNLSVHLFSLPLLLCLFHKMPLLSIAYNLVFPLCVALSLVLLAISLVTFPIFPSMGSFLHSINNQWTSSFLFLTSQPPDAFDFSLRTTLFSTSLTVGIIAFLFFLFMHFSLKKKIFR